MGRQQALPPPDLQQRPASAPPQLESKSNARARFGPICFHATSISHSLCDLRLLIGQMVDKHFFLKKISTVMVVSGEPEEVRPIK